MGQDLATHTDRFLKWLNEGNAAAWPLVDELLELPSDAWDEWFASHPEARTWHVLQELVRIAEKNLSDALLLTDFVLRHADSIPPPAEVEFMHSYLCARAWKAREIALRHASDEQGAIQAFEKAAAIDQSVMFEQPPLTEDDNRRARELSREYGWERLRKA